MVIKPLISGVGSGAGYAASAHGFDASLEPAAPQSLTQFVDQAGLRLKQHLQSGYFSQLGLMWGGDLIGYSARLGLRGLGLHHHMVLSFLQLVADEGITSAVTAHLFRQFDHGNGAWKYEFGEGVLIRLLMIGAAKMIPKTLSVPGQIVARNLALGLAMTLGGLIGESISQKLGSKIQTTPWAKGFGYGLRGLDSLAILAKGQLMRKGLRTVEFQTHSLGRVRLDSDDIGRKLEAHLYGQPSSLSAHQRRELAHALLAPVAPVMGFPGAGVMVPRKRFPTYTPQQLIDGFDLKDLVTNKSPALVMAKSADEDVFSDTPLPLRGMAEGETLLKLLRQPTTDFKKMKQRQQLISDFGETDLSAMKALKDEAYLVWQGVKILDSPIAVAPRLKMSVLDAYHHADYRHLAAPHFEQAMDCLSRGKHALTQWITQLESSPSLFLKNIAATFKQHAKDVSPLDRNYFEDTSLYRNGPSFRGLCSSLNSDVHRVGAFLEFAKLVQDEGYDKARFDASQPRGFKKGWFFGQAKQSQVQNDSPQDTALTAYIGSNGSGKSFELKKQLWMQLCAQSLGYAPCESGNFDIYDSFHYLDRGRTRHHHGLSAFGDDIETWNNHIAHFGQKPFVLCDEPFSTASPQDQYRMCRGVAQYLGQRGARLFVATHNDKFIENLRQDKKAELYYFKTGSDDDGQIVYHYQLKEVQHPQDGDSRALDVAKKFGLDLSVIARAQHYLQGPIEAMALPPKATSRRVERYSEAQRDELKTQRASPEDLFDFKATPQTMAHLLSEDDDFKAGWQRGLVTGRGFGDHSRLFRDRPEVEHKEYLTQLLFNNSSPDTKELLERQATFRELAATDSYEDYSQLAKQVIWRLYFSHTPRAHSGDFLRFNLAINPFINRRGHVDTLKLSAQQHPDLLLLYLDMNAKILGEAFPASVAQMAQDLRTSLALKRQIEERVLSMDVKDLKACQQQEEAEPIREAAVWDALQALEQKFGRMPQGHPQNAGQLTRHHVRSYVRWLYRNHRGAYRDANAKLLKEQVLDGYTPWSSLLKHKPKAFRRRIGQVLRSLGEFDPRQGVGPINLARLQDLGSQNTELFNQGKLSLEDYFRNHNHIRNCTEWIEKASRNLGLGPREGPRLTPSAMAQKVHQQVRDLVEATKTLPARSFFDVDREAIRHELTELVAAKMAALERTHPEDYRHDTFAVALSFLLHPGDAMTDTISLLRSYNSIHTHQLANDLESQLRNYALLDRDQNALASGQQLSQHLSGVYKQGHADAWQSYYQLADERAALAAQYQLNIRYWDDIEPFFALRDIINVYQNRGSDEGIDRRQVDDLFDAWKRSLGEHPATMHFRDRIHEVWVNGSDTKGDSYQKIFEDLYHQHVAGQAEKVLAVCAGLEDLGGKAYDLLVAVSPEMKFLQNEKRVADVKRGRLDLLEDLMDKEFRKAVNQSFADKRSSYGDRDAAAIQQNLRQTGALFLAGHMIAQQQQCEVLFDPEAPLVFKDSWSLMHPKASQVASDVAFEGDKRAQIMTGAYMSGKTFWLKKFLIDTLWPHLTGHAPAARASSPVIDNVIYLDRVQSKQDRNLSAFQNEVLFWKKLFKVVDQQPQTLVVAQLDEIFSTTSPRYQQALTFAVIERLLQKGVHLALASHNHEVIERLQQTYPNQVHPYHFRYKEESTPDGPKFVPTYELTSGHERSHALAVARSRGMEEEILEYALAA